MAESIIDRCQLIPPTKLAELQHLLAYIIKRSESKEFRKLAKASARPSPLVQHPQKLP
jgi:hypothetical protein